MSWNNQSVKRSLWHITNLLLNCADGSSISLHQLWCESLWLRKEMHMFLSLPNASNVSPDFIFWSLLSCNCIKLIIQWNFSLGCLITLDLLIHFPYHVCVFQVQVGRLRRFHFASFSKQLINQLAVATYKKASPRFTTKAHKIISISVVYKSWGSCTLQVKDKHKFKDFAMLATDFVSTGIRQRYKTMLGLEFSGLDESGEQVMGLVPAEGLSTHIVRNQTFTWKVPEHWFVYLCKIMPTNRLFPMRKVSCKQTFELIFFWHQKYASACILAFNARVFTGNSYRYSGEFVHKPVIVNERLQWCKMQTLRAGIKILFTK